MKVPPRKAQSVSTTDVTSTKSEVGGQRSAATNTRSEIESQPAAAEPTAEKPLFPKKRLSPKEPAARVAGAVGAAETKARIAQGVVKPMMERMREMHDAMAQDRETAKKNPAYRFKTQQGWTDHFGLKSTKTIQRDCDYMRDRLNLPVYPMKARGGLGYTEDVGAFPLVSFSRGALVAICAAWRALEGYRGTSFEAEIEPTMKKLLGGLGMELTDYLDRVLKRISFRSAGFQARMDPDIFETVTQALLDETELEFDYVTLEDARAGKGAKRRLVRPRDLAWIDGAFYLFTEDLHRKLAIREFALCRMSNVENTGTLFTASTPFEVKAALDKAFGAHTSGKPELVEVQFDAETAVLIRERDWHETQMRKELGGGALLFSMTVPVCPVVERWVLGFGKGATVVKPATLREKVAGELRGGAGNYGG